jgi:DNA modification methylase
MDGEIEDSALTSDTTRDAQAAREGDQKSETERAREVEDTHERGREKMKELEQDPPEKLEDWPTDEAKYVTFGGPEGDHSYEEGPERKLGPSEVRHHEGGKVTVGGEEVDNPEEYKGDPIPGGPTDPNSPDPTAERIRKQREGGEEDGGDEG